jgi:hypothetical protein
VFCINGWRFNMGRHDNRRYIHHAILRRVAVVSNSELSEFIMELGDTFYSTPLVPTAMRLN